MLKKLAFIAAASAILLSLPTTAFGAAGTTTGYVHFRSAPSVGSKIYTTLPKNEQVEVLEKVNKWWYKVQEGNRTGYISSNYLKLQESLGASGTTTGYVHFRSAPSVGSRIYSTLPKNKQVEVLQKVNKWWYKIKANGRTGYLSANYLNVRGSVQSGSSAAKQASGTTADKIIAYGQRFLGTPYKFGAKNYKSSGKFDCSSFAQYVYKHFGIDLPRVSRQQAKEGHYVARSNLRKGDLVFFRVGSGKRIGHVGIYAGNGKILHTYGKGGVKFSSMKSGYWSTHYVTARRVL